MKTNNPRSLLASMLLALGATLSTAQDSVENMGTLSDLLEAGIYLQEVKSDLGAAISTYKEIIANEVVARELAAEAHFRLALCYNDEGKNTQGQALLSKLVADYPEQTEWVQRAKELLPAEFTPRSTPWKNGERIEYVWRLPTGNVIGRSFATYYKIEWEGRALWKLDHRMFIMGNRFTSVEFDPETFETVYSEMVSDQTGRIQSWFNPNYIEVKYENKEAKSRIDQATAVYDNEQSVVLMRQFPAEVGFTTKKPIFINFVGTTVEIFFEVAALETIETPMGVFDCYRVDIDVNGSNQSVFLTNDENRYIVQMQVGGVTGQAVRVETIQPNTTTEYRDEELGISFTHPSDWSTMLAFDPLDNGGTHLIALEPGAYGGFNFFAQPNSILSRNELGNPAQIADNIMKDVSGQVENYELIESSKTAFMIGDMNAFSCEAKFTGEDGVESRYILIVTMNEDEHYAFHGRMPIEVYPEFAHEFRSIAESLRVE